MTYLADGAGHPGGRRRAHASCSSIYDAHRPHARVMGIMLVGFVPDAVGRPQRLRAAADRRARRSSLRRDGTQAGAARHACRSPPRTGSRPRAGRSGGRPGATVALRGERRRRRGATSPSARPTSSVRRGAPRALALLRPRAAQRHLRQRAARLLVRQPRRRPRLPAPLHARPGVYRLFCTLHPVDDGRHGAGAAVSGSRWRPRRRRLHAGPRRSSSPRTCAAPAPAITSTMTFTRPSEPRRSASPRASRPPSPTTRRSPCPAATPADEAGRRPAREAAGSGRSRRCRRSGTAPGPVHLMRRPAAWSASSAPTPGSSLHARARATIRALRRRQLRC